mmetsp:Transcript_4422/g.18855  ORF Transcript_4422/g.18855 Transcript_4422/m.18855 type:complete len:142 (+) Transcript_4422:1779-2204(+)
MCRDGGSRPRSFLSGPLERGVEVPECRCESSWRTLRRIDESREDCLLCILASLLELDSPSDSNPPKEIVVDIEFALVLKSSSDDVEKRLSLLLASEQSEAAKSPDVHTSKAFRSDSPDKYVINMPIERFGMVMLGSSICQA